MAVEWYVSAGFRKSSQADSAGALIVKRANRIQEGFHFLDDDPLLLGRQLILLRRIPCSLLRDEGEENPP